MRLAERVHEKNESGRRQSTLSRFSNFMDSCLWSLRFRYLVWRVDGNTKRLYRKYCKKGYHRVQNQLYSCSDGKREIRVEFIACGNCNYKFFSTIEDKRKYLLLNSTKRQSLAKIEKMFKKK